MENSILMITDSNFDSEIMAHNGLSLVEFWAPWCRPCLIMSHVIREVSLKYVGKLKVGALDVDDHMETATKFQIRSLPTVLLFKNGVLLDQIIGSFSADALSSKIEKYI